MRRTLAGAALALIGVLAVSSGAASQEYRAGSIRIDHPWSRATAPTAPAAGGFMALTNTGTTPDRLVSAASDIAETTELHTHINEGGVMRMRPVEDIAIPPGETVALRPGGLHVMFIGLRQPLAEGSRFPLTLTFEQAGTVTVEVGVEAAGAMGTGAMGGGQGQGQGHSGN